MDYINGLRDNFISRTVFSTNSMGFSQVIMNDSFPINWGTDIGDTPTPTNTRT